MATRNVLAPSRVPSGATENGDGIALGTGPVTVDAYIDFLCPFCRMFEEQHGPAVDELVDRGIVTLVYHPLGFLDRLSPWFDDPGTPYRDLGANYFDDHDRQHVQRALVRRLERLGYAVTLQPAA